MRSLRLDDELDRRLTNAAALAGESVSEFIRRAVAKRAADVLDGVPGRFADVAGVIHGGGGRAEQTGEAFEELLAGDAR